MYGGRFYVFPGLENGNCWMENKKRIQEIKLILFFQVTWFITESFAMLWAYCGRLGSENKENLSCCFQIFPFH